ncbi:MAG: zinc ABC transporter substrate-binding protein [Kurthia sp.]|nr:zinc ABC transporter substrate-binding protein [Candidatus Kurthia equi]
MKKITLLTLIAVLALFTAACGNDTAQKNSDKIEIYTTVYPLQYLSERIGGDHVQVSSIYPPGSNEHSFEPTQKDMIHMADADLFFYIGLGLEGFVTNAKKTLAKENVTMVQTTKDVSDEKLALSTSSEHDHEGEEHEDEDEEHNHEHGNTDPHVWISPIIAQDLATSVKDALVKKDASHKADYEKNYKAVIQDLQKLDTEYKEMADQAKQKTFFVSHASFGYIAGSYGLEQEAIAGLNSQDEPSQKELTEIADEAKKDNIKYILFEQNVSSKLSEVIKKDVGAESLTINNLSVLMQEDIVAKKDYLSIMEDNLKTFEKALNN